MTKGWTTWRARKRPILVSLQWYWRMRLLFYRKYIQIIINTFYFRLFNKYTNHDALSSIHKTSQKRVIFYFKKVQFRYNSQFIKIMSIDTKNSSNINNIVVIFVYFYIFLIRTQIKFEANWCGFKQIKAKGTSQKTSHPTVHCQQRPTISVQSCLFNRDWLLPFVICAICDVCSFFYVLSFAPKKLNGSKQRHQQKQLNWGKYSKRII